MDFFYKPPQEGADECEALEENYMNCLMQKSLKDRVFANRCKLDSILWFHLECPKSKDKFDDPVEFRLKWRDWFAQQKQDAESVIDNSAEGKRVRQEFDAQLNPEDINLRQDAVAFFKEHQQYDPEIHPETDNEDTDTLVEAPADIPAKERQYHDMPTPSPITVADSIKFGGKL